MISRIFIILILLLCNISVAGDYWNYKGSFKITRYCSCEKCCGKWARYKQTKMQTPIRYGVVAVDPNVIPLGRQIKIEGFPTIFSVEDIGGAVNGYHIDVYHYSHKYCVRWGTQNRMVWEQKNGNIVDVVVDKGLDIIHIGAEIVATPVCFLIRG